MIAFDPENDFDCDTTNLEEVILNILDTGSMTSTRLKKVSEGKMGRSISFKTYSKHLNQLLNDGMTTIEHDKGRGSTRKYAITDNGSKRIQLGLIKSNPHYFIFKQIYANLLFRDIDLGITFATGDLKYLLNLLQISENQLKIQHIEENYFDHVQVSNLESPYLERRLPVYVIFHYKPVRSTYIEESIEYREHIYYHFCTEMNPVFRYTLPGLSINDFINKRLADRLTRRHVEHIFEVLVKMGIIRPVGQFRGETRYIISDDELLDLIRDMQRLNELEKEFNYFWFANFGKPDEEQLDKIKLFYPDDKTINRYLMLLEIQRYEGRKELISKKGTEYFQRQKKRVESLLAEFKIKELDIITSVKERHDKTIQKYRFMSDIISSICPMLYH
jgi:hypothetical protein